jgi:hypothetical protein
MKKSTLLMPAIAMMVITLIMPAFSAGQPTLQSLQNDVGNLTADQNGMFSWAGGASKNISIIQDALIGKAGLIDLVYNLTDIITGPSGILNRLDALEKAASPAAFKKAVLDLILSDPDIKQAIRDDVVTGNQLAQPTQTAPATVMIGGQVAATGVQDQALYPTSTNGGVRVYNPWTKALRGVVAS